MALPNASGSFQLEIDCPWCSKNVDLLCREIFDWRPYKGMDAADFLNQFAARKFEARHIASGSQSSDRGPFLHRHDAKDLVEAYSFGTCPKCRSPIIVLFKSSLRDIHSLRNANPESAMARSAFAAQYLTIEGTVPSPETVKLPTSAPEKVKEFWPHTVASLERGDPPSRIVSECSSILDVCLKDLGAPDGPRRQRIAKLKDAYILTKDLANWGEILWQDGNDAVHDIEATPTDARQHVEFLKLFLQVAYNLNDQIKARRARDANNGK